MSTAELKEEICRKWEILCLIYRVIRFEILQTLPLLQ